MPANRQQILDWVASGHLDADKLEHALAITNSAPSAAAQLRFISAVVLTFAVTLLCSGVIFFFAFNWAELSRYAKFAIAQTALLLSLLPLLRLKLTNSLGQAALFSASLLVGALLALVGQTYQSGADNYQLFLIWAILITPWTLLARMPALWLLLLALLNLSLVLALDTLATDRLPAPFSHPGWLLFALNTSATGLWHLITSSAAVTPLLRWGGQSISLYSLLIITVLALDYISLWSVHDVLALPIWTIFAALWLYFYRIRQLDLTMLSALSMAAIVLIVTALSNALTDQMATTGLLLLLALSVMGLSSAAALWLKHLSQNSKTTPTQPNNRATHD